MKKVKIEKLVYGGKGMGRINDKVCFAQNALPGETVEIEITKDKTNFIEAKAINIENPSPARESPLCDYNDICGGCQYQHMSYAEEVKWKETQIREFLIKQLKISDDLFLPIIPSSKPYGYRNHITLHRTKNGWGFVNEDNENMVSIEKCLIANDHLNSIFKDVDFSYNHQRQDDVTVRLGAGEKIITSKEDTFFDITLGSIQFKTHSKCFFQNNLEITLKLSEKIKALYEASQYDHFWDLYSGVGTFTALTDPRKSQVLCVESHPKCIEALEINLKNINLAAEIAAEPVEACIGDILEESRLGPVMAILDPPKSGLAPQAAKALSGGKGPETIAYISCHMGALGRDLKTLTEASYVIESVQAFDMFPRTKHIETLVILKKKT